MTTAHAQIWVSSPHNGIGYYGLRDEISDTLSREHFQAIMEGARDPSVTYARTGYLGFMTKADRGDSLFVVGSLEEALSIRGFRYHPSDVEATVVRCHKSVVGRYGYTTSGGNSNGGRR